MSQRPRYLLTGASSGIGEALARHLVAQGFDLVLAARREEALRLLASELQTRHAGSTVIAHSLDVTDPAACREAVHFSQQVLGGLDGVIANAGLALTGKAGAGHFANTELMIRTNLIGAIACLEAGATLFREQGKGHLVAISSVAGQRGMPRMSGYAASKAGLSAYMQSLAAEFYQRPISTSLILPGYIDTPLSQGAAHRPFLIGAEQGAALIAKAILKHRTKAFIPCWPWSILGRVLPWLPTALVARL